jgi:hypothetical protein
VPIFTDGSFGWPRGRGSGIVDFVVIGARPRLAAFCLLDVAIFDLLRV